MINLTNVSKEYIVVKKKVNALSEINLCIKKGEIFGIIGYSGAGKSTLVRCMNLLEKPSTGQVEIGGVDLTALPSAKLQSERKKIGMIFQHFNLLSSKTIFENVAFPLRLNKVPKKMIQNRVDELLQLVGLEDHRNKYPSQLSGGQKQRVGIARALANQPDVLLCDEATSALDPQTTQSILELLLDIQRKLKLTIVIITHEMQVVQAICDRVAVMDMGKVVEEEKVIDIMLQPKHEITKKLIAETTGDDKMNTILQQADRKLLKISFRGEQTYEPILFDVIKETGVSLSILQGSISRLKETPYGQLIVEIFGDQASFERTIQSLQDHHVQLEVL
ncbi:methionine ABC transporter ATP-binding protein [Longirhabdus pacifica]|uniref:methionine ABC transporter ATP-binding protein n=1 Tax=Longirhabdus pacifica TaxID=2305227 RepID=UPI0010091D88|nr:methionine ABC transporter ATP-binding protein [Longirhabdus pacifica]